MHQHEALTKEKDREENKEYHRSKRLFHATMLHKNMSSRKFSSVTSEKKFQTNSMLCTSY